MEYLAESQKTSHNLINGLLHSPLVRVEPALVDLDYHWMLRETEVITEIKSHDGRAVGLGTTNFHPRSVFLDHLQANDNGNLISDDITFKVHNVFAAAPYHQHILHEYDPLQTINGRVKAVVNVERNKSISKTHSAMDLTSLLLEKQMGIRSIDSATMGRHAGVSRFQLLLEPSFTGKSALERLQGLLDRWVKQELPIQIELLPAEEVLEMDELQNWESLSNKLVLPSKIPVVHFAEIGSVACDGSHVTNTSEIKRIRIDYVKPGQPGGTRLYAWAE